MFKSLSSGDTVIRSVYVCSHFPSSIIGDYEVKRREHNMMQLYESQDSLRPEEMKPRSYGTDGRDKNPNSLKNLIQNGKDNDGL